jgi:hypothetical protein
MIILGVLTLRQLADYTLSQRKIVSGCRFFEGVLWTIPNAKPIFVKAHTQISHFNSHIYPI